LDVAPLSGATALGNITVSPAPMGSRYHVAPGQPADQPAGQRRSPFGWTPSCRTGRPKSWPHQPTELEVGHRVLGVAPPGGGHFVAPGRST
jgi:hypothetical protein